jgi:hypothetical protein
MAIKKSELYSSLWKSCDELRGGMDASQYKDYILTLLFVKYVSIAVQKVLTGGLPASVFVRLHGSRSGSGRGGGRERQRTGAATGYADLDVGACGGGSNWV